ncbi:MAG: 4Fe-4S dicluster domain-containing protein [Candidatus Rokuibacteriota bacterium]
MRYGFVIDHRLCIGCHACTVACKEENRVPLGAFRTWVKYVERGAFPHTRRYFSVLRCNHCDAAPCVTICPTVALYRRADGIVDFDGDRCIGCKSCMQACPYDALYIDPETNTAAKCNYCAHRIEVGLEPACVIVCPVQAIVAGDLDDPGSRIARLVAREPVEVRKAEQGTRPKVFYVGADTAALTPALQTSGATYLWGERPPAEADLVAMVARARASEAAVDPAQARTVYDAPHEPWPWGWKVAAYLWTKSVAAGALLVAAAGVLVGAAEGKTLSGIQAPLVALVFLALTTALLVLDLKRPERFLWILTRGNRSSWLVRGAWILLGFGGIAAVWLVAGLTANVGMLRILALPAIVLAAAAAGYSALLFGQCEGRNFWQSPLHLPHLLAGAVVAGAASLTILHVLTGHDNWGPELTGVEPLRLAMLAGLTVHGALLACDYFAPHTNVDVARAARLVTHGPWRHRFWGGVVLAGVLAPFAVAWQGPGWATLASALALAGLWVYEDLWIRAGQSVPLS